MSDSASRTKSVAKGEPTTSASGDSGPLKQATEHSQLVPTVDRTVIAQSPIAGPGEYYPTGTVATLAKVLIGQQLDHFQLHELVGGGGMGAVFRASDTRLDRIVAVKVIPSLGRDLETLKRFRIEAQSAAKLDHPHIARVYYVGETEAWSYIVFEYVEGTNLRDLIVRHGPLSIDDAVCYTCQAAEALQHAADRSVVHRDIKPSNLLVTPQGIIKVVDMGLARTTALDRSTNDLTASGVTLGTFDYISPEQARDPRAADVRSDLYSLGCTLYYMLTGRPPYPDGTAMQKLLMHGSVQADDPSDFRDDVSADLSAIIRKLMAKKPADRYQQPYDLIADLQCLANFESLTKSQQAVGFVVPAVAIERTLFEMATPWVMGTLAVIGSTWYLHSQYAASASFEIPIEPVTLSIEEAENRGTKNDGPFAKDPSKPADISKSMEFVFPAHNGPLASNENLNGLAIPEFGNMPLPNFDSANSSSGIFSAPSASLNPLNQKVTPPAPGQLESKARVLWVRPFESAEMVTDQANEYRYLTGNFADALALAETNLDIEEIWLDDDVWIIDEPLKLKRSSIAIRSAPDRKARIEVRIPKNSMPTLGTNALLDRIIAIHVGSNQLILNDLDLYVVPPDSGSGGLCLIGLSAGGSVRAMRSTVTFSNNGASWRTSYIGNLPIVSSTISSTTKPVNEPLQIVMEDVVVRGDGDLIALDIAQRMELYWKNGLLALNGRMLDLGGAREASRTPLTIRLDLEEVTVAARQGLARIRLSKEGGFPICVSRDSKNCVYSTERGYPLITIENGELDGDQAINASLSAWLDFRGQDNAYDEAIDTLVKWTSSKGISSKIGFETASKEFFSERAPETSIRWVHPRPIQKPFEQQTAGDYLQREGNFRPGFRPELLPNH